MFLRTLNLDLQILEHPHKHRAVNPGWIGTDNSTIRVRSRSHNQEQDGNTGGMYDRFNKLRLIANKDFLVHFRSMYFPWFSTIIYRINSRIWVPSFRSVSWRSSFVFGGSSSRMLHMSKDDHRFRESNVRLTTRSWLHTQTRQNHSNNSISNLIIVVIHWIITKGPDLEIPHKIDELWFPLFRIRSC
jgi:hypothetical protein